VQECNGCGACCVAPDIAAIDKPVGVRCPDLTEALRCGIYERRPQICRDYAADHFCDEIDAATLEGRVQNFLGAFGLQREAAENRARGLTSMKIARSLPVLP
jgi:Fe-S-cluster containining protein